jgi:hypothetical protein
MSSSIAQAKSIYHEKGVGGNVARMEEKRNGNKMLVGNWRIKSLRRKCNTKVHHKGI